MNDYIVSVLLGIVEGLTEFLPVSSTAHLRIAEAMLHINLADPYWKMYTIVIQLGAILALIFLFLGRILEFFRTFPKGESGNRTALNHPLSLTLIAFFCTAIPAFLLTKVIGKHLESLRLMATSLLVGGIIMWVVDAWSVRQVPTTEDVEQMTLGQAIWIGLCQVMSAVFPGTSRSMSTIAAGQLVRMTRSVALEFSFLVSIPTMVAATGYDLLRTLHPRHTDVAAGDRTAGHDQSRLARAFHRLRGFVHHRAAGGGVVPDVGPPPWLRHLRCLSHRVGDIALYLCQALHWNVEPVRSRPLRDLWLCFSGPP